MLGRNIISIDGRNMAHVDVAPDHYRVLWKNRVSNDKTLEAFRDFYEEIRDSDKEYVRMNYGLRALSKLSPSFLFVEFTTSPTGLTLDQFFKQGLQVDKEEVYITTPSLDLTFVPEAARSDQERFDISVISMVGGISYILPLFIQRTYSSVPDSYIPIIKGQLEHLVGDVGK